MWSFCCPRIARRRNLDVSMLPDSNVQESSRYWRQSLAKFLCVCRYAKEHVTDSLAVKLIIWYVHGIFYRTSVAPQRSGFFSKVMTWQLERLNWRTTLTRAYSEEFSICANLKQLLDLIIWVADLKINQNSSTVSNAAVTLALEPCLLVPFLFT